VPSLYLFQLRPNLTVEDAVGLYLKQEQVEYAEPDYAIGQSDILESKTLDPLFTQQWSLNNTGQSGGTIDADINTVESWLIETGDTNVVIGAIDSGVDYNHNDIKNNLWQNPTYNSGNSATVGVQLSQSLYNQYSYLKPWEPSNRSLLISLVP